MIDVVRAADTRRTETPNATMTTLASPTLGASGERDCIAPFELAALASDVDDNPTRLHRPKLL